MPVSADDTEYLKIYARIRKIMPWEPNKKAIKFNKTAIEASSTKSKHQKHSYGFSRVFDPSMDNRDCFNEICKPMANQVLDGFNAVLIAYGQTGSGKTHSLLGKPKRNILGILPMVMEFFLKKNVTVTLGAVEAFGHHVNKIELFDLYNELTWTRNWGEKYSKTSLGENEMTWVTPNDGAHAAELVAKAQKASHFAPTGKNPESSRGHISFIVKVRQENKAEFQMIQSYFVIVDLAGSEGETAFTPEFKRMVDPSTLMARRLEAGVINTGLSQLQIIFNELKVRRRLTGMRGVGLRRVLHPYINTKCVLAVLFCISPSKINKRSTVATLKFAVQAGMVKVAPVKEAIVTNWPVLVKGLKDMIEALNRDIDDRERTIREQEKEINRLMDEKESGWKATADGKKQYAKQKARPHLRQRSKLPTNLVAMLGDAEADVEQEAEDEFDEKDRADVDEYENDKLLEEGIQYARGEKEAVAAVLGIEKEEAIRKSSIFQAGAPFRQSQLMKESELQGSQANMAKPGAPATQESINAAFAHLAYDEYKNSGVTINENMGIDFEQDHMPTDNMTREMLVERVEVLESMLEAEKALNESYLYSQQVIIDHLAETNEGLLAFFRVKFKLLQKKKTKREEHYKD